MKILVIEDEKLLADAIKNLLMERGFEVETAFDGSTGEAYGELGIYDLIILDVMLPGMDGFQVAKTLRNRHCATPILMLTAKSDLASCTLICGEKSVRLSAREFDVCRFLMEAGKNNLSKETLLVKVWGFQSNASENHVEVYVGFLRKKLHSIGSNVKIEAIRRQGYHLEVKNS